LRTAALLAGGRAAGEDLLQGALERVLRRGAKVSGDLEAYLRRVLYNLAVDQWRLRRRQPETLTDLQPSGHPDTDRATAQPDQTNHITLRLSLLEALARLPKRQRAILVLRYFEQLGESETAEALNCSVGNVKAQTSRGLARLRALCPDLADGAPTPESADQEISRGVTR
jgi:RNA polymerase sigma-70 factor (sigma-E family)